MADTKAPASSAPQVEPWMRPPGPPLPPGYVEKTIVVGDYKFAVLVSSSQDRWCVSVPGTEILVDEPSEELALAAAGAAIEALSQEMEPPAEDAAADEEIPIPDDEPEEDAEDDDEEPQDGAAETIRATVDGTEAIINRRPPRQESLIVPSLSDALDNMHVAETKLAKATTAETKAKEGKKTAQSVYDQARAAVIAAAERVVTPGLPLTEGGDE